MTDRPPVPEGWEFRLSHDRRLFAFYDPGNGPWFVPEPAMRGRFIDSADMDRLDWYRYVPEPDGDGSLADVLRGTAEIEARALDDAATALEAQSCTCGCRRGAEFLRQRSAVIRATAETEGNSR